jgi:hypothetical protein
MNVVGKGDNHLVWGILVCVSGRNDVIELVSYSEIVVFLRKFKNVNGFANECLSTHSAVGFTKGIANQVGNKFRKTRFRSLFLF